MIYVVYEDLLDQCVLRGLFFRIILSCRLSIAKVFFSYGKRTVYWA